MTDVLFLGTGAGVPSRTRSLPCVAVRRGPDIILFDCGEGAQRQMMISPFSFMKVSAIFITHLHGDHILGLPGLLQTMGMSGRRNLLTIGGPEGTAASVKAMLAACERTYVEKVPSDPLKELEFPLKVIEMETSEIRFDGYSVSSFPTDHSVRSIGFVFREDDLPGRFNAAKAKGLGIKQDEFSLLRKGVPVRGVAPDSVIGPPRPGCRIVYTGDTAPSPAITAASAGADLLRHESTYAGSESELAKAYKHSTSMDAARCARDAGVKMLALIHVSNRYDDPAMLGKEASSIFPDTVVPSDMTLITLPRKIR
jgi:ribonuclease Z